MVITNETLAPGNGANFVGTSDNVIHKSVLQ